MTYILLGFLGLAVILFGCLFWDKPTLLIYGIILFCFVNDMLISFFAVPEAIRYVADLLSIYLMVIGVVMVFIRPWKLHAGIPIAIIGLLALVAVASYCFNDYSIVSFGVGVFQFFRGFCFFIACICILQKEDVNRLMNLFLVAAFANLAVSLFEYFRYHAKWDNNGGLFGIIVGCNGKMNLYIVIVSVIVAVLYLHKKISVVPAVGVLGSCLITATISELKIYYLELILCIALVVLFSKPSKKTVAFVVGGGIAIWLAILVLGELYPLFRDFFNLESMLEYATEDYGTSEGSVNRLSGVPMMLSDYLHTPMQKTFGLGLGNAHEGTAFYNQHEYLKYVYFYVSYVVTEMGLAGLLGLMSFFLINGVISIRFAFRDKENFPYYLISGVVSVFSIVFIIYDSSLITVTSYLLYFWLAVPYIMKKEQKVRV
ncbi:MAG: hypothetical protein IJD26_08440 [Lachnospiraceae bacterium]|nr:hypothetical protein [Lachnospiraceae bacterium]